MDMILETIEAALRRKGLTDAAASKLAVGHSSLIKNLKMPRDGEKRYNLPALQKLADVLDLELYFGPKRETGIVEHAIIDGHDFAPIPRLDVRLSAGNGTENGVPEVVETLAFRHDWLQSISLNPSNAVLVGIDGDSMVPELRHGDLALIDRSRTMPRSGQVYAFTDIDGSTRVKRIDVLPGQGYILRSDNAEYRTEARLGDEANRVQIVGLVVWSGHTWETR